MRQPILALALVLVGSLWAAAPPALPRALTAQEQKEVDALLAKGTRHANAGEFEQATKVAQQIADYQRARQGARHWQAIDARFAVEDWKLMAAVAAKDRAEVLRARSINRQGVALLNQGRPQEAEKPLRQALGIYQKVLGENHPDTAQGYNNIAGCLQALGKSSEALPLYQKALGIYQKVLGENHPDTATSYNNVALCLDDLGKSSEALPLFQKALGMSLKVLGQNHPRTAASYSSVAICLHALGKSSEALALFQKALAIRLKVLGQNHPDTALSYNNVASCLDALGKSSEALPPHRQALAIRLKVLGENHPHMAQSYNNVAVCLDALGKSSEALPLHRQALAIRLKMLGENHPNTATCYNNLAGCLHDLGKSSEALPLYQKALGICQKLLGENHPHTALSYNGVAVCLNALGKSSEALPLYQKALGIRLKVLGENHPSTAGSYNNVAFCLDALGKSSEALPLYQKALGIYQKVLGKNHPDTATSYNNVALCLDDLGKSSEALPLYRKALGIRQKMLGENHPDTAGSYNNVASSLVFTGEASQAARLLQRSLPGQEAARCHRTRTSGFDRAVAQSGKQSPRAWLAALLAYLKQPRNAFAHAEASLARGLLDDLASTSNPDLVRLRDLQARLGKLDTALIAFASLEKPSAEQRTRYNALVREQRSVVSELTQLVAEDSARRVLPLSRIQRSIPDDSALVLWIDVGVRWACVVRPSGRPEWVSLPGSGKNGAVTKEDESLPTRLHQSFTDPGTTPQERQKLADAFIAQLFDPVRPALKGVKRLFVVPSGPLARVPLDSLVSDFAIHYVPSGSVLALTREKHRTVDGKSLLALGDPIFEQAPPPEPPATGVLLTAVLPGSNADKAGLRSGDVLLSIGSVPTDSYDDLKGALLQAPAKITFWRDGQRYSGRLLAVPLGATVDNRSARAAVRAWRREREALAMRGTGHKRLPGTRLEVEAISALVKGSTTLLGSDASEQKLDELIDTGKLKKFRLILLATHGETNEQTPARSALILAQDKLPDPLTQVLAKKHPYDGRLTVSRIRERWDLDADLVVLSACETGLGKDAKGDGLLGFAQAFLSKGARSVVLSRWKVDDTATSLLMIRFYENLLGKRKDLKNPLGRAAALDEAKKWLRSLSRKDAERLATLHSGGVLRGSEGDEKVPAKLKPIELNGDKPFGHPFYWAAFTLIGDPD